MADDDRDDSPLPSPSGSASATAGLLAGVAARNATAPFDVLKIRFQVQVEPLRGGAGGGHYTGMAQAVRRIVASEGAAALWRGNVAASVLASAYSGVQFPVYAATKRWLDAGSERWWSPMACGIVGAAVATSATYPLDLVRTRFSAQGEPRIWATYAETVLAIWRGGGAARFYQGMGPTLAQVTPYMGLTFAAYDVASSNLPQSTLGRLAAGTIAGALGKVLVTPLDVVKKRLQINSAEFARNRHERYGAAPSAEATMRGQAADILSREGALAFWKGVQPAVLKSAIAAAVNFTVYHELMQRWREEEQPYG